MPHAQQPLDSRLSTYIENARDERVELNGFSKDDVPLPLRLPEPGRRGPSYLVMPSLGESLVLHIRTTRATASIPS